MTSPEDLFTDDFNQLISAARGEEQRMLSLLQMMVTTSNQGHGVASFPISTDQQYLTDHGEEVLQAGLNAGPGATFEPPTPDVQPEQHAVDDEPNNRPDLFTDQFRQALSDANDHGNAGSEYRSAVADLQDLVNAAASGQGVKLLDPTPGRDDPLSEPDPYGVEHYDHRADEEGVQIAFWNIDGANGVLDTREMLTAEGQAVLNAALDAGPGVTFDPQHAVAPAQEPTPAVDPQALTTEQYVAEHVDARELGSQGTQKRRALEQFDDLVVAAATGSGVNLPTMQGDAFQDMQPSDIHVADHRGIGEGIRISYWQQDGQDGILDSREILTPQGQDVLSAALHAGEGNSFDPHAPIPLPPLRQDGVSVDPDPTGEFDPNDHLGGSVGPTNDAQSQWASASPGNLGVAGLSSEQNTTPAAQGWGQQLEQPHRPQM